MHLRYDPFEKNTFVHFRYHIFEILHTAQCGLLKTANRGLSLQSPLAYLPGNPTMVGFLASETELIQFLRASDE